LVTAVTVRKDDRRGVYFSLQPLPSREPVGTDSFLDDDGQYRRAEFLAASQEVKERGIRADQRPYVDLGNSNADGFARRRCLLPLDRYEVHLHGQAHGAVTIPTILTVRIHTHACTLHEPITRATWG
jgi:hypothetical protein